MKFKNEKRLPDPQIIKGGKSVGNYSSIADAIGAAESGDTIMLEDNGNFNESFLTISINLDFKVINNGTATINAEGKGWIFNIADGVTVNLQSLILENGAGDQGGAIQNGKGKLTVNNCNFKNNTATEAGGAIFNNGTLIVTNSTFKNNSAANAGGAIYNNLANLTVTGSNLINNKVTSTDATLSSGGAILNFQESGSAGSAKVKFNRIIGNKAINGSAIYTFGENMDATLNWWRVTFGNNVAKQISNNDGGIVNYNPWIKLTISGENFNVEAEFIYDSNGKYHDPSKGLIPYFGSASFEPTKGSIKDVTNFSQGVASCVCTADCNISAHVDGNYVKISVPQS
jgi:predicted outer membrane repeat protein